MMNHKHNVELISIIIPALDSAKYIAAMLDSVYAQTYKKIEVIVAYDIKSTDNTRAILEEYNKKYNLIITEGNDTSSGIARNRGFALATGDFVIFLDDDDLIIPTYLENLINVYQTHPDVDSVCGGRIIADEDNLYKTYKKALRSKNEYVEFTQLDALHDKIEPKNTLIGAPWLWLVKRMMILENDIKFPNFSYGDDTVWVFQIILHSEKIGLTTKKGYIWITHPTSICNNPISPLDKWRKYDFYHKEVNKLLSDNHIELLDSLKNATNRRFVLQISAESYNKFSTLLNEYNIHKLYAEKYESRWMKLFVFGFNRSKFLFWIAGRLFHKLSPAHPIG